MQRMRLLYSFLRPFTACFLFCLVSTVTQAQTTGPIDPTLPPALDRDVVTIQATDPDGGEPNRVPPGQLRPILLDPLVFTVTRKGPIDFDLPVFYRVEGTAENGVDYDKLPGTVVIPSGSDSVTITVTPVDDDLVEPTETVAIVIESPICPAIFPPPRTCYLVGLENAAKGVILDNGAGGSPNFPPKVAIDKPTTGDSFPAPADIIIEAQTGDADGYAGYVEFFANGKKIGESTLVFIVAPKPGTILHHSFTWTNVPSGIYSITALAHDDGGATGESAPVVVKVSDNTPLPVVTIVATDAEAAEPPTPLPYAKFAPNPGVFTVTRTGPTDNPLAVFVAFHGTARNGLDYYMPPNVAQIPAGSASVDIVIQPINDQIIEDTETVEAALLLPVDIRPIPVTTTSQVTTVPPIDPIVVTLFPSYTLGTPSTATLKILDNGEGQPTGRPVVEIVAKDDSAAEPPTSDPSIKNLVDRGRFVITRTGGDTNLPILVFFGVEGTATEGTDYAALASPVLIPAGTDSVDLPVVPFFDTVKEGDESVVVRLFPSPIIDPPATTTAAGAVILPIQYYDLGSNVVAKVVIHDNSPSTGNLPPKVDITQPVARALFSEPATIEIVVQTVDADGYVPYVEFFAGKTRIGESRITWIRQPDPGSLITHTFTWENVPAGEYVLTAVAHDDLDATSVSAPVTVHVAPVAAFPVVTVVATDAEASEPTPLPPGMGLAVRPNVAVFTISRQGGELGHPLIVRYHMEGSARNGVDYGHLPGTVVIHPRELTATVVVEPIDDDLVEGDETVALVLDDAMCPSVAKQLPMCYTVGKPGAARAVIKDNDPNDSLPPKFSIYAVDPIATEGTNSIGRRHAVFQVVRTGRTNDAVTIGLKVTGTATPGKDYEALPDSVTVAAGERRSRLVVVPIDDSTPERIETVRVELLPAPVAVPRVIGWPAYLLGRAYRAEALILDNDHRMPPTLSLPDGAFHVCIPAPAGTDYEVEVSSDLEVWLPAGPANPIDEVMHYVDVDSDGSVVKFYRVVPAVP